MAKIADEVGGVLAGALDSGAGDSTPSGTEGDESLRKRGPGGSLRGRGGEAIGRNALEFALPASLADSVGSDGLRVVVEALAAFTSGNEGYERRGIGGG